MTQFLSLDAVKKAAREYYAKGKLTAQARLKKDRKCRYKSGPYRCAIGAALSRYSLSKINRYWNHQTFPGLWDQRIVAVRPYEIIPICRIQDAHDLWIRAVNKEGNDEEECRQRFLNLIDWKGVA